MKTNEWSGAPAPESPDDWWIDDDTGEYINAETCQRMGRDEAMQLILTGDRNGRE